MDNRIKTVFETHNNDVIYVLSDNTIFLKKEDAEKQNKANGAEIKEVTRADFFAEKKEANLPAGDSIETEEEKAARLQAEADAKQKAKDEAEDKLNIAVVIESIDYNEMKALVKALDIDVENMQKATLIAALTSYRESLKTE